VRICIVLSSGGSVVREVLKVPAIQKSIHSIVTDRECNAQAIAGEHGIQLVEIFSRDNLVFSDKLSAYCTSEKIDAIISFHTRLYAGTLLSSYKSKIINFHLSLLPAFPGFRAFENALSYGVKVLGTTVHFIDDTTDMGIPIIQTILPNDPALTVAERRHILFIQQCKSFIQLVDWLNEDRLQVERNVCQVKGARYHDAVFIPALDSVAAINFPG
jgi:phosphoribosylglycinamide formyltransferase-1